MWIVFPWNTLQVWFARYFANNLYITRLDKAFVISARIKVELDFFQLAHESAQFTFFAVNHNFKTNHIICLSVPIDF